MIATPEIIKRIIDEAQERHDIGQCVVIDFRSKEGNGVYVGSMGVGYFVAINGDRECRIEECFNKISKAYSPITPKEYNVWLSERCPLVEFAEYGRAKITSAEFDKRIGVSGLKCICSNREYWDKKITLRDQKGTVDPAP